MALAKAERERDATKVTLGWLEQRLNEHVITPLTENKVEQYMKTIGISQLKIEDTFQRITAVVDAADLDPHSLEYMSLLDRVVELQDQFTRIQKGFPSTSSSSSSRSTSAGGSDIRLPRLILPTFDGCLQDWISFRDMFVTAVHTNTTLSKSQKFTYLKSQLKGEAARQIQSMTITDTNYDIAWSQLSDRYQNDRELLFAILRKFMNQPLVTPQSSTAIRQLVDTSRECIRSLQVLKLPTDQWDAILLYAMMTKMDSTSKELWEQSLIDSSIPTLKSLFDFLEQRARALAASGNTASKSSSKPVSNSNPQGDKSRNQNRSLVYHTSSKSSSNCKCCDDSNHAIFRCQKFLGWSIQQRSEAIRKYKHCYNCLTEGHQVSQCLSNKGCRICGAWHHTLLHRPKQTDSVAATGQEQVPPAVVHLTSSTTTNRDVSLDTSSQKSSIPSVPSTTTAKEYDTLLATALVQVPDKHGRYHTLRILADNACNTNFATESCARRLGLPRKRFLTSASGLGGAPVGTSSGFTWFTVSPYFDNSISFSVSRCLLTTKITGKLPSSLFDHTRWSHLQNLRLADPAYHAPAEVDMLLGAEFFFAILEGGKQSGPPNSPAALETSFGWLIGGGSSDAPLIRPMVHTTHTLRDNTTPITAASDQEDEHLDSLLRKFWEIETDSTIRLQNAQESAAESHFMSTYQRNKDGRFIVNIPFKTPRPTLGSSVNIAMKRLQYLERRLQANPTYHQEYHSFMKEYEELGHMKEIPSVDSSSNPKTCYVPHHFVQKLSSTTTKFRVVFDASAKISNSVSLNDTMLVGPTIQDSLVDLLIRFRLHKVAFTADIAKMYRQILVDPVDAQMQRILWREDTSKPAKHYQLQTVTYGTAAAPFLATRVLQELSKLEKPNFPRAAEVSLRDFYVDDVMSGEPTVKEALTTQAQLLQLTKAGCLSLRKWSSNSQALLDALPPEMRETQSLPLFDMDSTVKTLGISWNPKKDYFIFKFNPQPINTKPLTKRIVLSEIARLFDPIGWLAPIIICAKILMQSLWTLHQGWDDVLPQPIQQQWIDFRKDIEGLVHLKINRCFFQGSNIICPSLNVPYPITDIKFCLAGFCDASQKAYAAVVYLCAYNGTSNSISLVTSKTRVAPTKVISLPRLELCGALLLAELMPSVQLALKIPIHSITAWTDSTVTLSWIQACSTRWKTFVANRVTKIQEKIPIAHVRGDENPADCPSRGITCKELLHHPLWWHGPTWLKSGIPNPNKVKLTETPEVLAEEKSKAICHITLSSTEEALLNGTSSLRQLLRVTAFIFRFVNNCRRPHQSSSTKLKKTASTPCLTPAELDHALMHWIKITQHQVFSDDMHSLTNGKPLSNKSKLLSLSPFVDSRGVLRVGGRLKSSSLSPDQKYPIVLPYQGHLTQLILTDAHLKHFHAGPQLMMSVIQRRFWIIKAKDAIRYHIRKCTTCVIHRAQTMQQVMGDLPAFRVNQARAFLNCGVDYAGPFRIRPILPRSTTTIKAYLALFVCCVTRALHLEVVSDLSTEAFIAALRRFVARRGRPTDLYSDCGTNFVGADNEMKEMLKLLLSNAHNQRVADHLSSEGTHWHFNPPAAPHMGGLWEAGVKSVKHHLLRIMGLQRLTYEEMSTAMCQIEAILNSRPLTPESTDPQDLAALTPGHFLIGGPLTAIPEPSLDHLIETQLSRWQLIQRMMQSFWKRWSAEYLTRLQKRPKWMSGNAKISIGDLVLIKDENLPPLKWKLGRIISMHPGSDSIVRVVSLKTSSSILKRPIVKLCPLPLESSEPTDVATTISI